MADEKSFEHRIALKWAKTVSRVLEVATVSAIVIATARVLSDSGKVDLWVIKDVPLKASWVFFFALTVAHVFSGLSFVQAIQNLRRTRSMQEQAYAREDIIVEGGGYVSVSVRRLPPVGKHLAHMSLADPSTWVAYGGGLAAILAVLPWWWDDGLRWPGMSSTIAIALVALLLLVVNWLTGSAWAVAVSMLGSPAPALQRPTTGATTLGLVFGGVVSASTGLLTIGLISGGLAWLANLLILQR